MLILAALAHAADGVPDVAVDGQLYRPPLDAEYTAWADDTSLNAGLRAGAVAGWVHEPVVWVWQDTGERVPVVGDAVGLDVLASYTYWRVRAGLDVPLYPSPRAMAAAAAAWATSPSTSRASCSSGAPRRWGSRSPSARTCPRGAPRCPSRATGSPTSSP